MADESAGEDRDASELILLANCPWVPFSQKAGTPLPGDTVLECQD
jgi:hypothetical protein